MLLSSRGLEPHATSVRRRPTAVRRPRHATVRSFGAEQAAFLAAHPDFARTSHIDELRATEYARLDAGGHVYLDHTGAGLYAASQLDAHRVLLGTEVLGNPHSVNPTSNAATALVDRTRAAVLRAFRASPDEYEVIFTANATGALRLVGEAYPFGDRGRFALTFDNHNSVNGIREFARARGARTGCVPMTAPELRGDEAALRRELDALPTGSRGLFAYPAQSNFSGVQHPLTWIAEAQQRGWHVLLDCAAYAPTNPLDLGTWRPDFVPISFYKLFGYPTGVGCLLARREALACLERPWFAGGTITAVSVQGDWHLLSGAPACFEDGTLNFLSIPAVEIGLRWIEKLGLDAIHTRARALASWLLERLGGLRHGNGAPAVTIYGPRRWERRGATIALNFLHPDGRVVDERLVDRRALAQGISLRTGCFCNPGSGEVALELSEDVVSRDALGGEDLIVDDYIDAMGLASGGAVRISLGLPSNFADAYAFLTFAEGFRDLTTVPSDLPPRLAC
jgi:selenocysteine lyase/cysteine desulfurase